LLRLWTIQRRQYVLATADGDAGLLRRSDLRSSVLLSAMSRYE
jgi:hypothetical protein